MQRSPVTARCSGCNGTHSICGDGSFRKHAPCGKVNAPLDAYRLHLVQAHQPTDVADELGDDDMDGEQNNTNRLEFNRRKQFSKAEVKWAKKAAAILRTMDEIMDQQLFINGHFDGRPSETFSNQMICLLEHTPPGKERIEAVAVGEFDHHGMPVDALEQQQYGGRSRRNTNRKNPDQDQSEANRLMEQVHRSLFRDRNISKSISFIKSHGISELANPAARQALAAKFAEESSEALTDDEMPEWLRYMPAITTTPADKPTEYSEWDVGRVKAYIMGKKQGAGADAWGYSFNSIQALITIEPGSLEALCRVCSYLPFGILNGRARDSITLGRGTVLKKNGIAGNYDVRPIVTRNPMWGLAGAMANKETAGLVAQICGPTQLGGGNIQGGTETMIHLVRTILHARPDCIVIKKDAKNAFGAAKNWVMRRILSAPGKLASTPFSNLALKDLEGTPMKIIFNDSKNGITVIHELNEGVPQGGTQSGAVYNIVQSLAIIDAFKGSDTLHFEYLDDIYILGPPKEALDVDERVDKNLEVLGILQNKSKREIYGIGVYAQEDRDRAEEAGYKWVERGEGIIVVGSPVGSAEYEKKICMERVREIEGQMDKLEKTVKNSSTFKQSVSQWQYSVVRKCIQPQFSHLMRTVPPKNTNEAAAMLDGIIRVQFARITSLDRKIRGASPREKKRVEKMITLPTSRGGYGFSDMAETTRAAYIGSYALTASQMASTYPAIKAMEDTPVLAELKEVIVQMITEGFIKQAEAESFTWANMCVKSQDKMQKNINERVIAVLAAENKKEAIEAKQPARVGARVHVRTMTEQARAATANANCDSGASAWLNASVVDVRNSMNNTTFKLAVLNRSLLGCMDDDQNNNIDWRCAACNSAVGHNGAHTRCCPKMVEEGTRQSIRNSQHAQVVDGLVRTLMGASSQTGYAVSPRPSNLGVMFGQTPEGRARAVAAAAVRRTVREQREDARLGNMYGDILLIDTTGKDSRPDIVIDVTVAEPCTTAKGQGGIDKPGEAADKAEKRKRAKWKAEGFTIADSPHARMVVYSVDTTGSFGASARKFHELIGGMMARNRGAESSAIDTRRVTEKMSVICQGALAQTILKARESIHRVESRSEQQQRRNSAATGAARRGVGRIITPPVFSNNPFSRLYFGGAEDSDENEEENNNEEGESAGLNRGVELDCGEGERPTMSQEQRLRHQYQQQQINRRQPSGKQQTQHSKNRSNNNNDIDSDSGSDSAERLRLNNGRSAGACSSNSNSNSSSSSSSSSSKQIHSARTQLLINVLAGKRPDRSDSQRDDCNDQIVGSNDGSESTQPTIIVTDRVSQEMQTQQYEDAPGKDAEKEDEQTEGGQQQLEQLSTHSGTQAAHESDSYNSSSIKTHSTLSTTERNSKNKVEKRKRETISEQEGTECENDEQLHKKSTTVLQAAKTVRPKRRLEKLPADTRKSNQELIIEQRKRNREKEKTDRRQTAPSNEQQEQQQQTLQQDSIQNQGTESLDSEQPENQNKKSRTSDVEDEGAQEQEPDNSEISTQRQYRGNEDQSQSNDNNKRNKSNNENKNKNKNKNKIAEESNNLTGEKKEADADTPAADLAQKEVGRRTGGSRNSGGLSSLLGAIGIQPAAAGDNSDNVDNNNNNNYNNNSTNGISRKNKNAREYDATQINLDEEWGIDDEMEASRAKTRDAQEEEERTEDFDNSATGKEKQDRIEWWRASQKRAHEEHEILKKTINEAQQQQQQQKRKQTEIDSGTQSPSLIIPTFEQRSYIYRNMNRVDYDAMCKRVQEYRSPGGKKGKF